MIKVAKDNFSFKFNLCTVNAFILTLIELTKNVFKVQRRIKPDILITVWNKNNRSGVFRDIKINFLIDRKGRGSICVNLEKIIVIGQDSWGVVQC